MNKVMLASLFAIVLFNGSFASWVDITSVLQGKNKTIKNDNNSLVYVEIDKSQSLALNLKNGLSIKMQIIGNDTGSCFILKNNEVAKKIVIKKGVAEVKYYFEPGSYSLKGTTPIAVRAFRWVKIKMDNIMPEGGGYPEMMVHKNKQYEYYNVKNSMTTSFKISGPAKVNIYSRLIIPGDAYTQQLELNVRENNVSVLNKKEILKRSKFASLLSNKSSVLTEATINQIIVPQGVHTYTVSYNNSKGLVKFYKEQKMNIINSPVALRKKFGTFQVVQERSDVPSMGMLDALKKRL